MTEYLTAAEASEQLLHHLNELAPGWSAQQPDLAQRLALALADEPNQLLAQMSYEEFLDWLDEDTFAEWEDGKVVLMSPVSLRHQLILGFLAATIGEYVLRKQAGVVVTAPFQVRLAKIRRGREPDLLFVASANRHRLTDTYLDGPADLAVEIVSPESEQRDRVVKFREYAQVGIPEYWLVDPNRQQVDFYQLDAAGGYQRALPGADGRYYPRALPGFWLRPAWLWQEPLPSVVEVLREIGVV
jgi:Uma2 family endonuclease